MRGMRNDPEPGESEAVMGLETAQHVVGESPVSEVAVEDGIAELAVVGKALGCSRKCASTLSRYRSRRIRGLNSAKSWRSAPACKPQEHSKVVIQSDCGGIRQDAAVSDDCWRLVICGQGCRSRVRRSGLRDGSASMQCVLVGCGHTWCVAFCRLGVRISVSG